MACCEVSSGVWEKWIYNVYNQLALSIGWTHNYASGAIPEYWVPPQIYSWASGNVLSPKDLALYLKQVNHDGFFMYHTSQCRCSHNNWSGIFFGTTGVFARNCNARGKMVTSSICGETIKEEVFLF